MAALSMPLAQRVAPLAESQLRQVVAADPASKRLLLLAESVAQTDSTVLLTGESGAGKEVLARYIHDHSPRRDRPFVAINCAAISPTLLESELFGHERGAFSGAVKQHQGVFERASGGTLLLDEISEIPPDMQVKLLRVLQERTLVRVGGRDTLKLDLRVIATSNRDLKRCVSEGTFRLDLYYRLNVFPLRVPALRERPDDIVPLAHYLLAQLTARSGTRIQTITPRALQHLRGHDYPGNVRELTNVLERASILALGDSIIDVHHVVLETEVSPLRPNLASLGWADEEPQDDGLDLDLEGDDSEVELYLDSAAPEPEDPCVIARRQAFSAGVDTLTEVKKRVILGTLEHFDGNRTRTAEALGVSLRTVRNHLAKYRARGIAVPSHD